jgi:hypothetical protein
MKGAACADAERISILCKSNIIKVVYAFTGFRYARKVSVPNA